MIYSDARRFRFGHHYFLWGYLVLVMHSACLLCISERVIYDSTGYNHRKDTTFYYFCNINGRL